jgi:hypothetical protein
LVLPRALTEKPARGPGTNLGFRPPRQRIGTTTGHQFHRHHTDARCGHDAGQVPFFVWTMLWTSVQIVLHMPPLTAALIMLLTANLAHFFDTQAGVPHILAASVLVFDTGGLHSHPAGLRHHFGSHSGVRVRCCSYESWAVAIWPSLVAMWAHHMFTVGMAMF